MLTCPKCNKRHIDRDEWATKPHRTHLCEYCGETWRPFEVATYGVEDEALRAENVRLRKALEAAIEKFQRIQAIAMPDTMIMARACDGEQEAQDALDAAPEETA